MIENITENKLSFKEIMKIGLEIYKNKFKTILHIILFIYIPIYSFLLIIKNFNPNTKEVYIDSLEGILELTFGIIVIMGITYIVREYLNDNDIGFNSATNKAFSNWGKALWTQLLTILIILLLVMLFIIPGIIWMVYYSFVIQLVALKNNGGKKILDLSKELVRGDWWRIAELSVIRFLVDIGLTGLFSYMPNNNLVKVLSDSFISIIDGYFIVVFAVMCLNLYFVKENY